MNILICRLQPWMAFEVAKNLSSQGHVIHSIDHGQLNEYIDSKLFNSCHQWLPLSSSDKELEYQFEQIVRKYEIRLVIVAQKLWRYSNIVEKVCSERFTDVIFTEYFFDDKLIFDNVGLQYTKDNQANGVCDLPIDWPRKDREEQPADRTKEDVIAQYNIPRDQKVVVIYGQVLWDMSLVESPESMSFDEYMDGLCKGNPDTTFLFKPHPKDTWGQPTSERYSYPNMIRVGESLRTLFQFPAHTAYSSTVIFEGVSRGLSFASAGYHLLQDHTYKITRGGFQDIYNKIISYKPDPLAVKRNASYLTNIYALSMSDPLLAGRLEHGIEYVVEKKAMR